MGPAVFAKQRFVTLSTQVANLPKSNRPSLVIPTGAQRSGGTCGLRKAEVRKLCPSKSPTFRKVTALLPFVIPTGA